MIPLQIEWFLYNSRWWLVLYTSQTDSGHVYQGVQVYSSSITTMSSGHEVSECQLVTLGSTTYVLYMLEFLFTRVCLWWKIPVLWSLVCDMMYWLVTKIGENRKKEKEKLLGEVWCHPQDQRIYLLPGFRTPPDYYEYLSTWVEYNGGHSNQTHEYHGI